MLGNFVFMDSRYALPPEKKTARPKNLGEARGLIRDCFEANGWDEAMQRVYLESLPLAGKHRWPLEQLAPDDIRTVVADLDNSRMVLLDQ